MAGSGGRITRILGPTVPTTLQPHAWGAFVFELWDPQPLPTTSDVSNRDSAAVASTITRLPLRQRLWLVRPGVNPYHFQYRCGTDTPATVTGSTASGRDRDYRTRDATSVPSDSPAQNLLSTNEAAAGGTGNSITLNALASSSNMYNGQLLVVRTGTSQDQSRIISAYNGTTRSPPSSVDH